MLLTQGLLETLFHQSVLIQFAIFLAVGLVVYAIACGFLVFCNRRQARPAEWIPVAPFATSITTLFGLFLAFHASSIWGNIARAERNIFRGSNESLAAWWQEHAWNPTE